MVNAGEVLGNTTKTNFMSRSEFGESEDVDVWFETYFPEVISRTANFRLDKRAYSGVNVFILGNSSFGVLGTNKLGEDVSSYTDSRILEQKMFVTYDDSFVDSTKLVLGSTSAQGDGAGSLFFDSAGSGGVIGPTTVPWYNSNWSKREKITIASENVGSELRNFPVFLPLNKLSATFFSTVLSDGGDIRVTGSDGVTEYPREVVYIDTAAGSGELHFNAGSIGNTVDNDYYLYYGNSSATEPAVGAAFGRNNVWTNYKAVYHMTEDPSSSAPQMIDSTGTGYDLTSEGGMLSTDSGQGMMGSALNIRLGDIDVENSSLSENLNTDWTFSMWAQIPEFGAGYLMGMDTGTTNSYFYFYVYGNNRLFCRLKGSSGGFVDTTTTSTYVDNAWHRIAYTWEDSIDRANFDVDGDTRISTVSGAALGFSTFTRLTLGRTKIDSTYMTGSIDEVRLYVGSMTTEWGSTEYSNQKDPDTFFTSVTTELPSAESGSDMQTVNLGSDVQLATSKFHNAVVSIYGDSTHLMTGSASSDGGNNWTVIPDFDTKFGIATVGSEPVLRLNVLSGSAIVTRVYASFYGSDIN